MRIGVICRKGTRRHIHAGACGMGNCKGQLLIITAHRNQVHDDGSICSEVVKPRPIDLPPWPRASQWSRR